MKKAISTDIAKAIERLKQNNNDFELFTDWLADSFDEKVGEMLRMDKDNIQVGQGYLQALDDIMQKIKCSRETLVRSNKNRDTLLGLN